MDYILSCGGGEENTPAYEKRKEGEKQVEKHNGRGGLTLDRVATLLEKAREMRARISRCSSTTAMAPLQFPHLPPSLLAQPAHVCTCRPDTFSPEDTARVSANQLNLRYVVCCHILYILLLLFVSARNGDACLRYVFFYRAVWNLNWLSCMGT